MSFVQRAIDVTLSIGKGADGEAGADVYTLTGHRVSVSITVSGGLSQGQAGIRIYGLPIATQNKLSSLGVSPIRQRNNRVSVLAGDANGMTLVFAGTIQEAWSDFGGVPEQFLEITSYAGMIEALKPVPASSYAGAGDVATIMGDLAKLAGLTFENNGVQATLSNPYFWGTARDQIRRCADAANINWLIDRGTLAIWPTGGARSGSVPLISPQTGLRGYPTLGRMNNIRLTTLFNPAIVFGSKIQVQSAVTPACGMWVVYALSHELEAQISDGQWFTTLEAAPPGADAPLT